MRWIAQTATPTYTEEAFPVNELQCPTQLLRPREVANDIGTKGTGSVLTIKLEQSMSNCNCERMFASRAKLMTQCARYCNIGSFNGPLLISQLARYYKRPLHEDIIWSQTLYQSTPTNESDDVCHRAYSRHQHDSLCRFQERSSRKLASRAWAGVAAAFD